MKNLNLALKAAELNYIQVTTAVSTAILGVSYPPSQGKFSDDVSSIMKSITAFLAAHESPLLVNVYPYFSYINNQKDIPLAYALFNSKQVVVKDGQLGYKNIFDAITDAVYSALEIAGGASVEIVVSESGWPSKGNGTPKRPGKNIETYVFAIFNENLKPLGTEQNFGLYNPDMTEVYHVEFPN
ncbi:Glucan endo-1,3-beta-glucosidase [Quillaja saponaria]|uniref:glucan endo-1,3-beta-D-glucosidase n=1 Tax=Quillaja saponaria TaxID=32244 RepID=A0AAD7P697_QUISA|nr:Glucan endo-1,3-beta-glucosidase [Quillaja saponaria]